MSEDSQRPIVVKRVKKSAHGHHGGAWKIAYADFVTAMMAFFLLMWLLGSTTSGDLKGISEFFQTPLKVAGGGDVNGDGFDDVVAGAFNEDDTQQDQGAAYVFLGAINPGTNPAATLRVKVVSHPPRSGYQ